MTDVLARIIFEKNINASNSHAVDALNKAASPVDNDDPIVQLAYSVMALRDAVLMVGTEIFKESK